MRSRVAFASVVLALLCAWGAIAHAQPRPITRPQPRPAAEYVPDEVLVGMPRSGHWLSSLARLESVGGPVLAHTPAIGMFRLKLHRGDTVDAAIQRLRASGLVTYAEPNYILHATSTPNDFYYASQWAITKTQSDQAWDVWTPLQQVIVAIVDTGVDGTHPDLTNKMYRINGSIAGYNAFSQTAGAASDDFGHGTHCAGIAAAEINNGTGVAGIAGWNPAIPGSGSYIKIMPVKVLDSSGSGPTSVVADGVVYAADHGAKVISLSLGSAGYDSTLDAAVQHAWSVGCVVVAAAGNSGVNTPFYPAAHANVVSVAATDSSDTMASFSNYGNWVTMAAPGVNILSTTPTYAAGGGFPLNYAYLQGTSMACPHVSGAAALIMAQNPSLTNAQVVNCLINNTDPYSTYPGHTPGSVHGRLNVLKALQAAGNGGPPSAPAGLIAAAGNTRIGLQWNAVGSAATYNIKRATVSGGPYTTIATGVTATQYIDTGLTNGTAYYYVVSGTNLAGTGGDSSEATATPTGAIKINCGGSIDYISPTTGLWSPDTYASGGSTVTYSARTISNSTDSALYLAVRYSNTNFSYSIPVSAGSYTLKLHFIELYYNSAGQRVCNVTANGQTVLTNYDAYAAAGAMNKVDIQSIPLTVSGSTLTVTIQPTVGYPNLAAIEVVPSAPSAPAAPTGLTATGSMGQIALAWNPSPGATSYNVMRGTTTGGPYTTISSGSSSISFTDTAVSNGTTYYYVVAAVNGVGTSANSNEASAAPATGLKINCGGSTYVSGTTGTWLADAYYAGGSTASYSARTIAGTSDGTMYLATRYTNTSFTYNLPIPAGTYTLKLYFAELYYNSAGQRTCNVIVNGSTALSNFDAFVAAGGMNKATVQSIPVTVGGSGITLTVQAVIGYPNLAAIEVVASTPSAPSAPTNLTASGGNTQVALAWDAMPGATSYNVKRATVSGGPYTTVVTGLGSPSYTDSGLTNGAAYYYVVDAVNGIGTSADSAEATATPSNVLRINCGGSAYSTSGGVSFLADTYATGGATATYAPRTITNSTDGPLYLTSRYTNGSFTYNLPVTAGSYTLKLHFIELYYNAPGQRLCNVTANGATVLTNYDAYAAAGGMNTVNIQSIPVTVGAGGLAVTLQAVVGYPNLAAIEVVQSAPVAPSAPTSLAATGSLGQVALSWAGSAGATSYDVKRATTSGGPYTTIAAGVNTTTYNDTAVTNGTTYYYVVDAANGVGTSGNSNEASATPLSSLKINCGGTTYTSGTTGIWQADTFYSGGLTASYANRPLTNSSDGPLYLTSRYTNTSFTYNLPCAAGSHTLKLHFVELYYNATGQRLCNVIVNGSQVLTNFDAYSAAGGMNTVTIQSIPVTVGANGITLTIQAVYGYPNLAAIEVQ